MERGSYKIIKVNGEEQVFNVRPDIRRIMQQIGAETLDSVTLDRAKRTVMLVDDTGMVDGKPANAKATDLYHGICKPGTIHQIHGDVAIVNDGDFA